MKRRDFFKTLAAAVVAVAGPQLSTAVTAPPIESFDVLAVIRSSLVRSLMEYEDRSFFACMSL